MAQRFEEAIPHFEETLKKYPHDLRILKNLVVCYAAVENLEAAMNKLMSILHITSDINELREGGECPCRGALGKWYKNPPKTMSRTEYLLSVGILSMFCEPELSRAYFQQAHELAPDRSEITEILQTFSNRNQSKHTQT